MNGLTIHVSDSYVLLKDHNEAQVVRLYFTDSIKPGKINSEHIEVNESLIFPFSCIVRLFVHPRFRKTSIREFNGSVVKESFRDAFGDGGNYSADVIRHDEKGKTKFVKIS